MRLSSDRAVCVFVGYANELALRQMQKTKQPEPEPQWVPGEMREHNLAGRAQNKFFCSPSECIGSDTRVGGTTPQLAPWSPGWFTGAASLLWWG